MLSYHIVKNHELWELKPQGGSALKTFKTKAEAVAAARDIITKRGGGSVKIHRENGTIEEERTYPKSSDPSRTKG
jgi:hypothetical protein